MKTDMHLNACPRNQHYEFVKLIENVDPGHLLMECHGLGKVRVLLAGSISHTITRHRHHPVLPVPIPE